MVDMPKPIWRAQTRLYPISMLLHPGEHRRNPRDLQPGERRLGWFILPPFQRPPAWSTAQRVRFIESLWLDLPVSVYVFAANQTGGMVDSWLIDGQQRIGALLAYRDGEFAVFGSTFDQLSQTDRRRFENKVFPSIEIDEENPEILADIYDRLAYGGTSHEPKRQPYSARFGAIHHEDYSGFLFTVSPPKFAGDVADALNKAGR